MTLHTIRCSLLNFPSADKPKVTAVVCGDCGRKKKDFHLHLWILETKVFKGLPNPLINGPWHIICQILSMGGKKALQVFAVIQLLTLGAVYTFKNMD